MVKRIAGVVLVLLGVLALYFGGFTFTKETHDAQLGPLQLEYKEKDRITIPKWLGAGTAVAGLVLVLLPGGGNRKK